MRYDYDNRNRYIQNTIQNTRAIFYTCKKGYVCEIRCNNLGYEILTNIFKSINTGKYEFVYIGEMIVPITIDESISFDPLSTSERFINYPIIIIGQRKMNLHPYSYLLHYFHTMEYDYYTREIIDMANIRREKEKG